MDFSCDDYAIDEYVNGCARALSSRTAMPSCNCTGRTHANLPNGISMGGNVGGFPPLVVEFSRNSQRLEIFALPHCVAQRSIVAHDQALAAAIPAAHDDVMQISRDRRATRFEASAFSASLRSHQQGRHCRGPCLATECARCMRRVRFRRRDLAGGILSSRGRRRRQTKNCRCKTGRPITTPESTPLRCFVFCDVPRARASMSEPRHDAGRGVRRRN